MFFTTINRAGFRPAASAELILIVAAFTFILPGLARAQKRIHTVFFDETDHELNVYRIYGKEPGKTLLLIGGIQGDEPGGYLSVDHYADMSLAKGNLIVVPRANFRSIVANRRKINDDMNRKFADDSKINYETKIVVILKKLISESDCLLNLHDGSGFFSEKWEGPYRNPKRYGQSIIADSDIFVNPKTGKTLHLGDMARSVCDQINKKIKKTVHQFHFNNHQTKASSSLHKEQRKSATYYALYTCGIPAFGIETSKSLPLEQKVRHHNLAVNAFMERLDIVPETPGINLVHPELDYLVVSVNDSLPIVVKNRQSLSVNSGDSIEISHIEANYERGLSVDIVGYGTANDMRKKTRIKGPAKAVVRKDYYPCGRIYIKIKEGKTKTGSHVAVADNQKSGADLMLYKLKINGDERIYQNYEYAKLVKGDTLEIIDVISNAQNTSDFVVNLKGFVGDPIINTGEDRGYIVNTGRDLWKRYSLKKKGRYYQVVVKNNGETLGKLFLDLQTPVLNYIVLETQDGRKRCLTPGDTIWVDAETPLKLFDVNTNITRNVGIKAYIAGLGSTRRPVNIDQSMVINGLLSNGNDKTPNHYRIDIERDRMFLGSVNLQCVREKHHEE